MKTLQRLCLATCLAGALASNATASAQSLALTTDSEEGFQRLIRMAETGQLGDEVSNANVAIAHDHVRLELDRAGGPGRVLLLTRAAATTAGYFDVAPGEGASVSDVQRVERALAAAFREDPFQVAGLEESHAGGVIPGLGDAWADGGWRAVVGAGERRMMVLAGRRYTIGVIAFLALAMLAGLALLWGSVPPRATLDH